MDDVSSADTPSVQGSPRRCTGTNARGRACMAWAVPGRAFCIAHDDDPAHQQLAQYARRMGGFARARPVPALPADLATPTALRRALEETINRLRRGDESAEIARVVIAAVAAVRPIVELEHIAARLDALEAQTVEHEALGGDPHDD